MGLFDKIFKSKTVETASSTIIKAEPETNFDELVARARTSGNATDMSSLYKAFFQLKEWTFIVSNNCTIENAKPFIGGIRGTTVFTDSKKADTYARLFGNFLTNDESTFIIKMSRENSLNMINELNRRGVFGVRINEGDIGWFSTVSGLFEIKDYLKIE